MPTQWVVLLEAAPDAGHGPIDGDDLRRLRQALCGSYGGFLLCRDRYALHVAATAASALEALAIVIARWSEAVRQLQLPAWELLRTEVCTRKEFEREFERADGAEIGFQAPERDGAPKEHDEIGRQLLHRAFSDPLTDLLDRQALAIGLETALAARCGCGPIAMVCLDLNDIQRLNAVFAPTTGDQILVAVAQRLAGTLRPRDLFARTGCHEYGVVLDESTEEAAVAVARRMLDTIRVPMVVSGQEIILAPSAGVAMSRPGDTAELVIANAGAALDAARATSARGPALFRSEP